MQSDDDAHLIPASTSNTETDGSSERRDATTAPPAPAGSVL
jgi:hypothetical protein